jgi:hypothetical protein
VAHGAPNQTKSQTPSRSHLLMDSHNWPSRRSWSESCFPARQTLTMSMSSHSHPIVLRCAASPSRRSARPENKWRARKALPFLSGICLCDVVLVLTLCGCGVCRACEDKSVRPVGCCGCVGKSARPAECVVDLCDVNRLMVVFVWSGLSSSIQHLPFFPS